MVVLVVAGVEESKAGEDVHVAAVATGKPVQLFDLPVVVPRDDVVAEVALLHLLTEERRFRDLPALPTLVDDGYGPLIRKWIRGSEVVLRAALATAGVYHCTSKTGGAGEGAASPTCWCARSVVLSVVWKTRWWDRTWR